MSSDLTVDQLTPGTAFRFLRIPPGSYATLGIVYVVVGRDRHNINWKRRLPGGALGSGSGDSISILRRFGQFEKVAA